jgi:hypothetical protein
MMAGMLSVRVTNAERKKLMELKAQRGCNNLSEVIRLLCGFPRTATGEIIDGADDIDGVDKMIRVCLRLVDRVENQGLTLTEIAKQLNIKQVKHQPIEVLAQPIAEQPLYEYRNGHKDPALPEGFKR